MAMLSVQSVPISEIIVVDSSSNDKTVEIALKNKVKLLTVERNEFDHGSTRTLAAQQTVGEIIVFFTQDAIPASREAVRSLVQPFVDDNEIAATYGRQLPSFKANPFAVHLRNFNYPGKSEVRRYRNRETLGLKSVFLSNSFSAYRRTILDKINFFQDNLILGEDTCAAGLILLEKKKIAYVAEASVYHSHNYTIEQEFKRYFDTGVLHQREKWLLETFGGAEGRGIAFVRSEITYLLDEKKWMLILPAILRNVLKFIAYKAGRSYSRLPKQLIPHLSMNRKWWYKPR